MSLTPICPNCGSVKVERQGKGKFKCLEPDCAEVAARRGLTVEWPKREANQQWRDPVAMSMDGYEGK